MPTKSTRDSNQSTYRRTLGQLYVALIRQQNAEKNRQVELDGIKEVGKRESAPPPTTTRKEHK